MPASGRTGIMISCFSFFFALASQMKNNLLVDNDLQLRLLNKLLDLHVCFVLVTHYFAPIPFKKNLHKQNIVKVDKEPCKQHNYLCNNITL